MATSRVPVRRREDFRVVSDHKLRGDQPFAVDELSSGLLRGEKSQVLLGVTGSGKTFTMAKVIESVNRPALVIAHNKTLAAQLFQELRQFFPDNAVEYFVSYYDYYQPEAYVPASDTYIQKESTINDEIDRLRLSATRALFEREDVIIVASVSCIYGLGSPEAYYGMLLVFTKGEVVDRSVILRKLVENRYERNDYELKRGTFRVRGDIIEIIPGYDDLGIRIELFDNELESICQFDPLSGRTLKALETVTIFPRTHYVAPKERAARAIGTIRKELDWFHRKLYDEVRLLEAERIQQRTLYDLEMLQEIGYCHGIENYSRHFTGREPGEPPPTLIDYLPKETIFIIDESHQTIPQIRGMYHGDRSRKTTLVEHGFRMPSALDNRPLNFEEFEQRVGQSIYMSATPGPYELEIASGLVVEQINRPTGLVDPVVEVRPVAGQVDDLLGDIQARVALRERVLVTTLTKRMAEDLTEYFTEMSVRCRYLHSDIDTLERIEILRDLRIGVFDVLVGINLLREGLDLPEVSLVAILDADKEGYLRSSGALIQTIGRAARNLNGKAILYADKETQSIQRALLETERRRSLQKLYNKKHGITPETIIKSIHGVIREQNHSKTSSESGSHVRLEEDYLFSNVEEVRNEIQRSRKLMKKAAKHLDFEKAAECRDYIRKLQQMELFDS